jgi:hypothetical protein
MQVNVLDMGEYCQQFFIRESLKQVSNNFEVQYILLRKYKHFIVNIT